MVDDTCHVTAMLKKRPFLADYLQSDTELKPDTEYCLNSLFTTQSQCAGVMAGGDTIPNLWGQR